MDFEIIAIGILQPSLPGFVASQFLVTARDTLRSHLGDKPINVVGLKAEMHESGVLHFGKRHLEDFNIAGIAAIEVGAIELPMLLEGETDRQAELLMIELDGASDIGNVKTNMRQACNHNCDLLFQSARQFKLALSCLV